MKIRGERACSDCGARWSYYETGEVSCPECGSLRSTAVSEPTEHTASPVSLELTPVRNAVDSQPLRNTADDAAAVAAEYLRAAGFVHAGELQPLGGTYLAAAELRRVGTTLGRLMDVTDEEELYFLSLLRGADAGERPSPDAVPETLHAERGLAVAATTERYLSDVRRVREGDDPELDRALSAITARRKRIEALDGAVSPAESEQLVRAVRDVGEYLIDGDETALARALERLPAET